MPVGIVRRDAATAAFFDGAARGELLIRRCDRCGAHAAPQTRTCPGCASAALSWTTATGGGSVVSWSVVHPKGAPTFTVAIVELDEGPWIQARLALAGEARPGLRVQAGFEQPEGGEAVPVFLSAPLPG